MKCCEYDTRYPTLSDQPNLHYLNAVLQESFRTASLVGAGVPHYTTEDIQAGGYTIPKGSMVYGSLYHIMNDKEHFKDPHTFKPGNNPIKLFCAIIFTTQGLYSGPVLKNFLWQ
jgi:cytochrome P450